MAGFAAGAYLKVVLYRGSMRNWGRALSAPTAPTPPGHPFRLLDYSRHFTSHWICHYPAIGFVRCDKIVFVAT